MSAAGADRHRSGHSRGSHPRGWPPPRKKHIPSDLMNWLRVLQIGLNSCSIEENLIQSDASTYLHTRPGNHDYTGKKPSNHAHSRPTLRNRVQHIYPPAPLDAQTWAKVQTWLSLPL